jgi:dihydroorotate dehydrogenase (NAD+) catalytic subunit
MPDLHVTLGPLVLKNPVLVAAGTYGYGLEFARSIRLERLGALVTKTLTLSPREGNPPPRLVETPSGMLNAVGIQNIGIEAFLRETLPALRCERVPVIVSILGESTHDVAAMVQQLDSANGVAGIELNLSCPNIKESSEFRVQSSELYQPATRNSQLATPLMVAQDPEATRTMVKAARAKTSKALIAKLSPDVTDLRPIAQAAEQAGADALSLVNTFVGMSIDSRTRRSRLGTMTGGVSGPAMRPLAVYRVWYTTQIIRIPVIGLGGIVRPEDALEFFLAGASAVAVGSANFADCRAPLRILRGLERYLKRQHLNSLEEIRGAINQQ